MESQHAPHPPPGVQPGQHGGHPSQHMPGTFRSQEAYRYPETHPQTASGGFQNPPQPFIYPSHAQQGSNPYQYQSQLHVTYYNPCPSYCGSQHFGPPPGAPPHHLPSHSVHGLQQPPPVQQSAQQTLYAAPYGYPTHGQPLQFSNLVHQFENRVPPERFRAGAPASHPPPTHASWTYAPANEPAARGLVPPPDGHIPIALGQDQVRLMSTHVNVPVKMHPLDASRCCQDLVLAESQRSVPSVQRMEQGAWDGCGSPFGESL